MAWFKVDDKFHSHPKVMELSTGAVGLWTLAGSWCADYLTDGAIKRGQIKRLGGSESEAQELVDVGLWVATEDGWQFRDWTDYQPTRDAIEAERDAAKDRMKRAREHRKRSPSVRANNGRTSGEIRESSDNPVPDPVPLTTSTSKASTPAADAAIEMQFEAWWKLYPRKIGKGQARKAFKTALSKTDADTLNAGVKSYVESVAGKDQQYIAHPATWLNGERWDDEPTPEAPAEKSPWDYTNEDYIRAEEALERRYAASLEPD